MLLPPLTGLALKQWIDSPKSKRQFIADGFLHSKSCLLVAADSGTGKSVISLQAALQLSCGAPLFGVLEVSRPYRCYYIQKERSIEEIGERIELMQKVISWSPDNFILDDKLQAFNLAKESNWKMIIDRIISYKPDIIFIDPIYAGTPGLSRDEVASSFTTFLTILEQASSATIWLNHHTPKDSYTKDGDKIIKDDPIYGSTWLKAHVTAAYHLTRSSDGVILKVKKDSHSNLLKEIELQFDPENFISVAKGEWGSGHDKLMRFISLMKRLNKTFTLEEIEANTNLCQRSILRYFVMGQFKELIKNVSPSGKKGLYTVL